MNELWIKSDLFAPKQELDSLDSTTSAVSLLYNVAGGNNIVTSVSFPHRDVADTEIGSDKVRLGAM